MMLATPASAQWADPYVGPYGSQYSNDNVYAEQQRYLQQQQTWQQLQAEQDRIREYQWRQQQQNFQDQVLRQLQQPRW
jgi:hypothetical protein